MERVAQKKGSQQVYPAMNLNMWMLKIYIIWLFELFII